MEKTIGMGEFIQICETRKNDKFGQLLTYICDTTNELLKPSSDIKDLGKPNNVLADLLICYMMDGDINYHFPKLKQILTKLHICDFSNPCKSVYPEINKKIYEFEDSLN